MTALLLILATLCAPTNPVGCPAPHRNTQPHTVRHAPRR